MQPMPLPVYNNPPPFPGMMNDNIASMRWESDPLVHQLYRMLGGYEITVNEHNQLVKQRDKNFNPLMNDIGIERVIALVRGVVNPVTSLSNIDDLEANMLINQVLVGFAATLLENMERWEVNTGDRSTIMNIMKTIVFSQVKRSVGGHESSNFRTQTFEQSLQQNFTQGANRAGGGGLMPWNWGGTKK